MKGESYEEFVDKFKPKLTTDDCMTPPLVYDAVRDWAVREYGLEGKRIMRPFWPGEDYTAVDYSGDCVVIDNPPFSILAKIKDFYNDRGISFFLFAPHLTLLGKKDNYTNYIICNCSVTYANGAKINTAFATNLGTTFIRTAPKLCRAIKRADDLAQQQTRVSLPKYKYPSNVISSALLGKISGVDFAINREDCTPIKALDGQKKQGKGIFGGGYLISNRKAAELKAAELKAATDVYEWKLSDREIKIIDTLSKL